MSQSQLRWCCMKLCDRGGENRQHRIPNEAVFRSLCPLCLCGDLLCPGPAAAAEKIGNTGFRMRPVSVVSVVCATVVAWFAVDRTEVGTTPAELHDLLTFWSVVQCW